jgi:hypothetical protein
VTAIHLAGIAAEAANPQTRYPSSRSGNVGFTSTPAGSFAQTAVNPGRPGERANSTEAV